MTFAEGPSFTYPFPSPRSQPPNCKKKGPVGRGASGKCSPKISPRCGKTAHKESTTPEELEMFIDLTSGTDQNVTMETEKTADGRDDLSEDTATEEITTATEKIVLDDCVEEQVAKEFDGGRQPPEPARQVTVLVKCAGHNIT